MRSLTTRRISFDEKHFAQKYGKGYSKEMFHASEAPIITHINNLLHSSGESYYGFSEIKLHLMKLGNLTFINVTFIL